MKYAVALIATLALTACGQAPSLPTAQAPLAAMAAQAKKKAGDEAKAVAWIKAHAGGDYWHIKPGKLFPDIDDGEAGLDGRMCTPEGGKLVADFANAWFKAYKKYQPLDYNPRRDVMITCTTSNDEPVMFIAVFDPAKNQGRLLGTAELVDIGYDMNQADFHRLFPDMGDVKDVDYARVADRLGEKATNLDFYKGR